MLRASECGYSYHFDALGLPIIQFPQDVVAMQELLWRVRPDLVIETGVARGGSVVMHAAQLALLEYADAVADGQLLDPSRPRRRVLGIDVEIRAHNRAAIETHPMSARIELLEGSSVALDVVEHARTRAGSADRILVCLDSNHTHAHVRAELEAYAPLVTPGSYLVVFDTIVEQLPKSLYPDRPWGPGDNPATAVAEFLREHPEFEVDQTIDNKLQLSVAPGGYLRRVR
ncbi:MAG: cephalosporin hydroxylase [Planctomycetaceae bacterium]|nr:cephalosporin hydroxylase [Planctomycetaceae bacterium]